MSQQFIGEYIKKQLITKIGEDNFDMVKKYDHSMAVLHDTASWVYAEGYIHHYKMTENELIRAVKDEFYKN